MTTPGDGPDRDDEQHTGAETRAGSQQLDVTRPDDPAGGVRLPWKSLKEINRRSAVLAGAGVASAAVVASALAARVAAASAAKRVANRVETVISPPSERTNHPIERKGVESASSTWLRPVLLGERRNLDA